MESSFCFVDLKFFCAIFEIKHSKEISPAQYRHINNEEKISLTEAQFGKVVRKCVLYRGESQELENGVEYKNVEEFLKGGILRF